eukprot:517967-Hanusia_phi.AAC.1
MYSVADAESSNANKIIHLNVGGQFFSTSRETLEAAGPSFFSVLIGGNFGGQKDAKGNLFIDRDPKLFSYVLNYLRSQCTHLAIDKTNKSKLQSMLVEAEFYAVQPLIAEIEELIANMDKQETEQKKKHWEYVGSTMTMGPSQPSAFKNLAPVNVSSSSVPLPPSLVRANMRTIRVLSSKPATPSLLRCL